MKRLPAITILTLMMSAAFIPGAHAQNAPALCKLSAVGAGTVTRLPLTPELAQQLQVNGAPGGLAEVHGDGHVMYNGQDLTQQTAAMCANGGAQPKGDAKVDTASGMATGKASDEQSPGTMNPLAPRKGHMRKHGAAAAGDHYVAPTSGLSPSEAIPDNNAAGTAETGTVPLTSNNATPPTGSSPGSSMAPLGSTAPAAPLPADQSSGAVFTPPPSNVTPPSNELTRPASNGSPLSPSISAPASISPPVGSTSGTAPSDLSSPPEPMHAGGGSGSSMAPTGPISSSSGGSSSSSSSSMGGGSSSGGSSSGGSSSGH